MKTIAFIPARGGSKSIPLKNIKNFCGKPLIYWVLKAMEHVDEIDEIIVATDSEEIEEVVLSFNFPKVVMYQRTAENASDTATTESVMLEYINQTQLSPNDIMVLVQATSPFTQSNHFQEALNSYRREKYDSLLTCVNNYRFFWNKDGTPLNYSYLNRPRRQDFEGTLMENGAFYINTIGNISNFKNRLSGKIGIYIMPDYTAYEIDEPDDWMIMENLMKKHVLKSN